MVAVSASAFPIDGLYGALRQLLPEPAKKKARWRKIVALLDSAFELGPRVQAWRTELKWLFVEVRHPTVHHGEESHETVPHPELDAHLSVEDRNYSAAGAERAVAIALDVVDTCFNNPKPVTAEWVERRRPLLGQLLR
jgi:hypothetical protein